MRSKTAFKLAADTSSMAVQGMKVRLFCLLGYPKQSRNTPQMVHCFFVKHLRSSPKIIAYSSNGSMSRRKNAVILGSAIRYPTGCQQTQKPQHNLGKIALRHNLQITLTCGLAFCVRNQKIIGLWCLGLIGSFLKWVCPWREWLSGMMKLYVTPCYIIWFEGVYLIPTVWWKKSRASRQFII